MREGVRERSFLFPVSSCVQFTKFFIFFNFTLEFVGNVVPREATHSQSSVSERHLAKLAAILAMAKVFIAKAQILRCVDGKNPVQMMAILAKMVMGSAAAKIAIREVLSAEY